MIVPVLGMHRSGSSALAGLLHHSGVVMGQDDEFIPKPLPQNPKGFYENYSFRQLNDRLLNQSPNNYRIKSWSTDIPEVHLSNDVRVRAREILVENCERSNTWGWKDPRTCLTSELWFSEIDSIGSLTETKVLFVFRSPQSVALSLFARNKIDKENALVLWQQYNQRALSQVNKWNLDVFFVCYEDLCRDVETCMNHIIHFLGVELEADTSIFDPGLNHSGILSFEPDCSNAEASNLARRLYQYSTKRQ